MACRMDGYRDWAVKGTGRILFVWAGFRSICKTREMNNRLSIFFFRNSKAKKQEKDSMGLLDHDCGGTREGWGFV